MEAVQVPRGCGPLMTSASAVRKGSRSSPSCIARSRFGEKSQPLERSPAGRRETSCPWASCRKSIPAKQPEPPRSPCLPDGYDRSIPLVIDPVLTFATYSGSMADNFGFTASYDAGGHLYGGGIVFSTGYPTTLGAFGPDFNGGTIDIGLTKFAPDGSSLIWSTYIGGTGSETPQIAPSRR